jgi:NodT family efflux transporter outer membrane factor (OMF) lipoprotein
MKYRALLITSLALGACTTGVDYEQPKPRAGEMDSWNGRLEGAISDDELDPVFLAHWWTALDDPALTSLIEQATEANLDLRMAEAQLRQAKAQRGIAEAEALPSVRASADAQRSGSADTTSEGYATGLDASWEVDLFGRIERSIEAAEADLQAAEEARRDVLVSVLAEVALNYVDLRTLQLRRALAESNLRNQKETLRIVQAQKEAGAVSQLDVDRATSNLASTSSRIPALEQQLRQIKNRLAVLLGKNPGALDAELVDTGALPIPPVQVAVGVPAETLRRRPDVRQAERRLAAETARVGVAIAELYPKFSMGGTIGLQSSSTSNLFDQASRVFSLGPRLQWNLFDGGATRQRIEVQNSVQEQALAQYERSVLQALEDVDNAITAFTKEQLSYVSLRIASEAASSAAELAETRYEAGETDFLGVLDAQRTRLNAQDQLAQSEGLIVANLIRLYKALGGGWDSAGAAAEGH